MTPTMKLIALLSIFLPISTYGFVVDMSMDISGNERLMCFVKMAQRNIGGVINAFRTGNPQQCRTCCSSSEARNQILSFPSPDYTFCGLYRICLDGKCVSLLDAAFNTQSNASISTNSSRIPSLRANSTGTQSTGLNMGMASIIPGFASFISQAGPPLASAGLSLASQAGSLLSAALQSQGGAAVSASQAAPSVQFQGPTGTATISANGLGTGLGTGFGTGVGTDGSVGYQHLVSQLNSLLSAGDDYDNGSVNSAAVADSLSALAAAFAR